MAIGDNYIQLAEIKDYMGLEITTEDARATAVCAAASRAVEDYCHRQFNQAATATARVYQPLSRFTCVVDDFFTTSGLVVSSDDDDDGVFETMWTVGSDYQVRPYKSEERRVGKECRSRW